MISPKFLASLILTLTFVSCSDNDKSSRLDSWIGEYIYGEEPVKAIAGYAMVMEWTLSINKKSDTYQGILEIDGQQTYIKALTNIVGDNKVIAIIYNNLIDGSDENLRKGDTLFILSRNGDKLKTKWSALEPRLSENSDKECNCFMQSGSSRPLTTKLSRAHLFLNNLRDSLRIEYAQTLSDKTKKELLENYHQRLQNYLLETYIDSIHVTVDEIEKDGWTVTTRLHDKDIEFKYSLTFEKNMPAKVDSVYKFMLGLKPGMDTIVNFSFMGTSQVNRPNDKTTPTFRIFAFPIPLEFTGD